MSWYADQHDIHCKQGVMVQSTEYYKSFIMHQVSVGLIGGNPYLNVVRPNISSTSSVISNPHHMASI
jgi:hypothetical protein